MLNYLKTDHGIVFTVNHISYHVDKEHWKYKEILKAITNEDPLVATQLYSLESPQQQLEDLCDKIENLGLSMADAEYAISKLRRTIDELKENANKVWCDLCQEEHV